MKRLPWWGWLIVVALLTGGGAVVYGKTRGLRNNNPGNVRKVPGVVWQGESAEQTDTAFTQFVAPEWGIRALVRVLKSYQKQGLTTVRGIINRYAPPTENVTSAYVAAVSKALNVDPDQQVNFTTQLDPLVRAIIRHENGVQPYPDDIISKGIALA